MKSIEEQTLKENEKPPIKAVLFDFDGLLFNSEPVWGKAYDVFVRKHDVLDKPELAPKMLGRGLREIVGIMVDEMGMKGNIADLVQEYRDTFYEIFLKEKDILMPGAKDLVERLKSRGLVIGLTTGGHRAFMIRKILENVGLLTYFDLIASSDDVQNGKPAPDIYLSSVSKLNLKSGECLALEDSANGVLAAKTAGVPVYGVNADGKMRRELAKAGAEKVYSSLSELTIP